MRSSYSEDDVILLLKDITGVVEPQETEERERQIQAGRHYSEMLPVEYVPSEKYMEAYRNALQHFSGSTADAVGRLAGKILHRRGRNVVLVSLARSGIPVGILLKRYIRKKYGVDVPHYAISIIRGRGIDDNAVKYLLKYHEAKALLFVDGWVGKGAILTELEKSVAAYDGISPELAVVADPAGMTELCGTHEDILIPSSCLNCTVSGLISRTFLRDDVIGEYDFHGAVYYGEMADADLSYDFIRHIEAEFDMASADFADGAEEAAADKRNTPFEHGIDEVRKIAQRFGVGDINLIKPGIGEATRVLLRRVPWKILIDEKAKDDPALAHLVRLAQERKAEIEYYPMDHYKACGIIRKMADV